MQMNLDPIENAHDRAGIELWAKAMGLVPSHVFNYPSVDNVFQFCIATDTWFVPDYDGDTVIDNERLENFRKAAVHFALSNLHDVAMFLDDDPEPTMAHMMQLMSNDPDTQGNPRWLIDPADLNNIVVRTFRPTHKD